MSHVTHINESVTHMNKSRRTHTPEAPPRWTSCRDICGSNRSVFHISQKSASCSIYSIKWLYSQLLRNSTWCDDICGVDCFLWNFSKLKLALQSNVLPCKYISVMTWTLNWVSQNFSKKKISQSWTQLCRYFWHYIYRSVLTCEKFEKQTDKYRKYHDTMEFLKSWLYSHFI